MLRRNFLKAGGIGVPAFSASRSIADIVQGGLIGKVTLVHLYGDSKLDTMQHIMGVRSPTRVSASPGAVSITYEYDNFLATHEPSAKPARAVYYGSAGTLTVGPAGWRIAS